MPYSEETLNEIEYDKDRLRAYFWHVAMINKYRLSKKKTDRHRALSAAFAECIMDNIDALVESSYKER